jgi:hypothetical protein
VFRRARLAKDSFGNLEAVLDALLGAMELMLSATNQPRVDATEETCSRMRKHAFMAMRGN